VGPAYQPIYLFFSSARDALMGRPGVTCSAQLGCGMPCFFFQKTVLFEICKLQI
jgi:hypothetical protein